MTDFTPGKPLRVYDSSGKWRDFSTDEFIGEKKHYLKGWLCSQGVQNLFINSDGDVYGASCYMNGSIGNVFRDFNPPKRWQTCGKSFCSCGADLFIPKVRAMKDTEQLRKYNNLPTIKENEDKTLNDDFVAMERTFDTSYKQVHWEIGRRCNYSCSYCWPAIHNNHERHKSLDELIDATTRIQKKFIGDSKCNFIITGGEPTANSAFLKWCQHLNSFNYHLSMHSNGSRKPEYYAELILYGDLNLSGHYEQWNPDKFLEVIRTVTQVKVEKNNKDVGHLEVKLMMTPGSRDLTIEMKHRIHSIPKFQEFCVLCIVPVKDNNAKFDGPLLEGYTKQDFKLFGNIDD